MYYMRQKSADLFLLPQSLQQETKILQDVVKFLPLQAAWLLLCHLVIAWLAVLMAEKLKDELVCLPVATNLL